jgi:hypothetical protein
LQFAVHSVQLYHSLGQLSMCPPLGKVIDGPCPLVLRALASTASADKLFTKVSEGLLATGRTITYVVVDWVTCQIGGLLLARNWVAVNSEARQLRERRIRWFD